MLDFMTFRCARILLGGIELMHMIAKGQMKDSGSGQTRAEKFNSVGDISIPHHAGPVSLSSLIDKTSIFGYQQS
jgi:hypothetical protein